MSKFDMFKSCYGTVIANKCFFASQVYYVPAQVFYNGAILPNMVTLLPILREIIIREDTWIVHGHGAFSSLAHDALFAAKLLDLKVLRCNRNEGSLKRPLLGYYLLLVFIT
jgi:hypothetical protein